MESEPMLTPRDKIPSTGGSEEVSTHDATWHRTASPTYNRLIYSSPWKGANCAAVTGSQAAVWAQWITLPTSHCPFHGSCFITRRAQLEVDGVCLPSQDSFSSDILYPKLVSMKLKILVQGSMKIPVDPERFMQNEFINTKFCYKRLEHTSGLYKLKQTRRRTTTTRKKKRRRKKKRLFWDQKFWF